MKRAVALTMLCASLCLPARAALDVGDSAPDFTVPAALGGKVFQFKLSEALAKGPVVLYFFPAAFSDGCSREAHLFAESIGTFKALGASVIGVSGDDLELITRFSVQVCQGKFPVAPARSGGALGPGQPEALTGTLDSLSCSRLASTGHATGEPGPGVAASASLSWPLARCQRDGSGAGP